MKGYTSVVAIILLAVIAFEASADPPRFKRKKYYGPIPYNTLSVTVGFIDGPSAEYFTDHLNEWAKQRGGRAVSEDFTTSPFAKVSFERQLSPNHFFRSSLCFSYIDLASAGDYVATVDLPDTSGVNVPLDVERTFKVYLFSVDLGFLYYFVSPEVRRFSPFVGGGFAAVIPMARLGTDSWNNVTGEPFDNPGETVSRNSFEAGIHTIFGMVYYLTNRYSAALEGRYQMAQSKFYHHDANFVIDYAGFTLGLTFNYHF
jgi:hypothetical protein